MTEALLILAGIGAGPALDGGLVPLMRLVSQFLLMIASRVLVAFGYRPRPPEAWSRSSRIAPVPRSARTSSGL